MLKELKNTVVHCKTREEYDRLMKIYEEAGWRWLSLSKPSKFDGYSKYEADTGIQCEDLFQMGSTATAVKNKWKVISLADFLREQGISSSKSEVRSLFRKYTVFKHDDCPLQLWCRDSEIQVRKNGRKRKTYTVTGDLDQWAEAFFDGYLAAQ